MKRVKFVALGCTILLLCQCSKSDENISSEILSFRSNPSVQINSDIETSILSKLKNPSEYVQLQIQDKLDLVPMKIRYDFNSDLYSDGTMDTELIYKDPGNMTFPRSEVPPSDLPEIKKIIVTGNTMKMYDIGNNEIINIPFNQEFLVNHSLDLIDRIINGYPDIMAYAQYIDNLPSGGYTQLNNRFIKVYFTESSGNNIIEVYDLEIDRLVGYFARNNSGELILRQLINYECLSGIAVLKKAWTQSYAETTNGFEIVNETTQIFHQFEIIQ